MWVKYVLASLFSLILATPALAQVDRADPQTETPSEDGNSALGDERNRITLDPRPPLVVPTEPLPAPDLPPDTSDLPEPDVSVPEAPVPDMDAPDYSRLSSNEERAARLDDMFARLSSAEDPEDAKLIAEEIWAVWLDSGSASVNLVLRRAAGAQNRGDNALARRLFDHVTRLEPDHAEGWARSARLALEETDFARAASESIRALTLEPRHFYSLWTLGNVLERFGRQEEALEAYREANALYPALENVADRVAALETQLDGGVL